jgi:CRISPR-associated protein (TIGR03986 family)
MMPDAIAPYNFVPMPNRIIPGGEVPKGDRYHADRYTGWFDIEITTITPTYTRAAKGLPGIITHRDQPVEFFHRGDAAKTPVMPGSSLRGMFRSVFEIITCSRMEFVSERRLFFRSFAVRSTTGLAQLYKDKFDKKRVLGGEIVEQNGGLALHVASSSSNGHGFVVVRSAEARAKYKTNSLNSTVPVHVVVDESDIFPPIDVPIAQIQRTADSIAGFLVIPGRDVNNRSWYQVILQPGDDDKYREIPTSVYEDYLAWGQMAHGSRFGRADGKAPRKLEAGQPAFALLDASGNITAIGANMMMPMRYDYSIAAVAARTPDTDEKSTVEYPRDIIDMTQAVFGYVNGPGEHKAQRTRVFFEDAVCATTDPWLAEGDGIRRPDVLSGPKPTAVQMYLGGGAPLQTWNNQDAVLRGHKRYWTRSAKAAYETLHLREPATNAPAENQITKICPVKHDVVFHGRIRFENLSLQELGALYATIQLPEGLTHRFGMAKNLGMGTIKVAVTHTSILDMAQRYASLDAGAGEMANAEEKLREAYTTFCARVAPKKASLWSAPRMLALASLMDNAWPDDIDLDSKSRQISIEGSLEETNDRQWKDRYELPQALRINPLTEADVEDVFPLPVPEKAAPKKQPKLVAAYQKGDKVKVTVVEIAFPHFHIQLPDGTILKQQSLFGQPAVGDVVTVTVSDLKGDGTIKSTKPK